MEEKNNEHQESFASLRKELIQQQESSMATLHEEFTNDRQLIDAVERNIERVSEASRHLPEELKTGFSHIPWREIAGIGNVLRHDYPSILPREIWATVTGDLPELEAAVSVMIEEIEAKRE